MPLNREEREQFEALAVVLERFRPIIDDLRARERDLLLKQPMKRLTALHRLGNRLLHAIGDASTPMEVKAQRVETVIADLSPTEQWIIARFAWVGITDAMDRGVLELLERDDQAKMHGGNED